MNSLFIFLFTFFHLTPQFLLPPVAAFKDRITKKPFGIYISPKSSPISPEKFTGFHTGVDVEYQDITSEVPVTAVGVGQIIYSGWVKGYGGVIAQSLTYQKQDYIVLYGHLNPSSLLPKNSQVKSGQQIGVLGQGYSSETDGERRHLHLSIIRGGVLNLRGYVPLKSQLSAWINPLDFYN